MKAINELIGLALKTMISKSLNELAPPYLSSLFWKNSHSTSHRLRNTSTDIWLLKEGTENGKKSFSVRGAKLWNSPQLTASKQPPRKLLNNIFTHQMNVALFLAFIFIFPCVKVFILFLKKTTIIIRTTYYNFCTRNKPWTDPELLSY